MARSRAGLEPHRTSFHCAADEAILPPIVDRKLAAILSADVKGYSRLMGEDEEATLRTLTSHRSTMAALIEKHHGRVVDTPGDNLLAEFGSAVDALRCAVEIQRELCARNAALAAGRRMEFRIGINVGDVLIEGERLYGDGVNIAARLEGLAEPGGICISGTVYDQVKNKLAIAFVELGEQRVKNIAEAVRAYRALWDSTSRDTSGLRERAARLVTLLRRRRPALIAAAVLLPAAIALLEGVWPPSSPRAAAPWRKASTLAVLPFQVLTTPAEAPHLGAAIADVITTQLASVKEIRVRPTSAILRFEESTASVQEIGRDVQAEHVVTGTLQQHGDRVRASVQLIRVEDGVLLWGDHFDLARADLLGLQDAIAEQVTAALEIPLTAAERERVYRRYTENAEAYELYLAGRGQYLRFTRDATRAAVEAYEAALRLDRSYALAWAGLATASAQMRLRFVPEAEMQQWEERAKQAATKAIELDPDLPEAHEALAAVYGATEFEWGRVIEESTRALELNPSLDLPHLLLARAFLHLGLPLEMVDREITAAQTANPGNRAEPLRIRGTAELFYGQFVESAAALEEAQRLSESIGVDWYFAQTLWYQGERERAESMLARLRGAGAAERRAQTTLASFLAARGERAQAEALLASLPAQAYVDHHVAYALAAAHAQLEHRSEALHWLRQAAETGFPCYPWFARDPLLQPLRDDSEFTQFLEELRRSWEGTKARYALYSSRRE